MMKPIFFIVIFSLSQVALSQELDLTKCGQRIGYRPGGASVIEARYAFNTELDILLNSCAVQKKLLNSANDYFYIRSFTQKSGKATLVYEVDDFTDSSKPMESTCTL